MEYRPFPSWRYGPAGQAGIFEREEDVPDGWVDHPAKVVEVGFAPPSESAPAPDPVFEAEADLQAALVEALFPLESDDLPSTGVDVPLEPSHAAESAPVSTVRKLGRGGAALPGVQSPALSDAVRRDAILAIRAGGEEISDHATDAEIMSVLNSSDE